MILLTSAQAVLALTSFVPYRTEGGLPLRWASDAIIEVHVGPAPNDAFPEATVQDLLENAFTTWLDVPCDDPTRVDIRPPGADVRGIDGVLDDSDHVVSVVWFTDATAWTERFGTKELARTILIHRSLSGEIVDADIAINFGTYLFSADPGCAADRYDLAATLTHEVGHVLGLDHSEVPSATMTANSQLGSCDLRTLDPDDVAGICASYSTPVVVEPAPEPSPEPTPEPGVEAEPTPPARDDGCAGAPPGAWLAALVLLLNRRGRRASGGCRRARRPSPARS